MEDIIYIKDFIKEPDMFNKIVDEHKFQTLTESNKESNAYRTGIYLSEMTETDDNIKYYLMRCSTNFEGPTEGFSKTDKQIIDKLNTEIPEYIKDKFRFNHVLAQIYNNKRKKARISSHSDKTKDMEPNGLIAFCSFYNTIEFKDRINGNKNYKFEESGDITFKGTTTLTKLCFKLKDPIKHPELEKTIEYILYPNSVIVITLNINRLYTHEIRPSVLPSENIPTRMGYVVRCSKTDCVYKKDEGKIYIYGTDEIKPLTEKDQITIKNLYLEENKSDNLLIYPKIYCSLNQGDYLKPILNTSTTTTLCECGCNKTRSDCCYRDGILHPVKFKKW